MQNKFFGSKLNTVILLVLVVILVYTLNFMKKTRVPNESSLPTTEDTASGTVPAIEGNVEDLVSFSVAPNSTVSGELSFTGSVKGGYFFEGNILINVLAVDGTVLKNSYATAITDWMTAEPVEFSGSIDLSDLPKGPAYIQILEDDPSDGEGGEPGSILIPVTIE